MNLSCNVRNRHACVQRHEAERELQQSRQHIASLEVQVQSLQNSLDARGVALADAERVAEESCKDAAVLRAQLTLSGPSWCASLYDYIFRASLPHSKQCATRGCPLRWNNSICAFSSVRIRVDCSIQLSCMWTTETKFNVCCSQHAPDSVVHGRKRSV